MEKTPHLTEGNPAFEIRIRRTCPGQAHWADDFAHNCSQCRHWGSKDKPRKRPRSQPAQSCGKFEELVGTRGPLVPADALACRFFSPNRFLPQKAHAGQKVKCYV
jgi:hypothetical protein